MKIRKAIAVTVIAATALVGTATIADASEAGEQTYLKIELESVRIPATGNTAEIEFVEVAGDSTNADSDVDGADFLAWQTSWGAEIGDGDFDLDGDVDGSDFLIWQNQNKIELKK